MLGLREHVDGAEAAGLVAEGGEEFCVAREGFRAAGDVHYPLRAEARGAFEEIRRGAGARGSSTRTSAFSPREARETRYSVASAAAKRAFPTPFRRALKRASATAERLNSMPSASPKSAAIVRPSVPTPQ